MADEWFKKFRKWRKEIDDSDKSVNNRLKIQVCEPLTVKLNPTEGTIEAVKKKLKKNAGIKEK